MRVVVDSQGRSPSCIRGVRTARPGPVAVGGAMRWTGDRLDSRGTDEERRRDKRIVATIDALVDHLAVMRGAAMTRASPKRFATRYAEIVYRFFYGTALGLGVVLSGRRRGRSEDRHGIERRAGAADDP